MSISFILVKIKLCVNLISSREPYILCALIKECLSKTGHHFPLVKIYIRKPRPSLITLTNALKGNFMT